jgi:3-oxoacyl-[acyl-carrier protein] reductase
MGDSRKRLVDVTEPEWDTVLGINLAGTFLFTRAALPHLFDRGRGNVINVSSGLGRRAIAGAGP